MTEPFWTNGIATLYQADARALPLADQSVHCCVTSPPYYGLRDYSLGQWEGGDPECDHLRLASDRQKPHELTDRMADTAAYGGDAPEPWPNGACGKCGATQQPAGIGLEPTLGEWLDNIVAVGREVWRVLRDDGTWFLNLGDSYAGSGKGHSANGFSDGDKQATNKGSVGVKPIARGKRDRSAVRAADAGAWAILPWTACPQRTSWASRGGRHSRCRMPVGFYVLRYVGPNPTPCQRA